MELRVAQPHATHSQKLRRLALKMMPGVACLAQPRSASHHIVNAACTDGSCFHTITAALAHASPNDVILLTPSVYFEHLKVDKAIDIVGCGDYPFGRDMYKDNKPGSKEPLFDLMSKEKRKKTYDTFVLTIDNVFKMLAVYFRLNAACLW